MEDAKDLAVLLRKIVIEMEKGLHRDYLHKDSFVNQLFAELNGVEAIL